MRRIIIAAWLISSLWACAESQTKSTAGEASSRTFDPVAIACPTYNRENAGDGFHAWAHGELLEHEEGDGILGTNLGHTLEALTFYCRSSAAGNANAAFAIGHIFDEGYTVNTMEKSGRAVTTHVPADKKVAFYWYQLAAQRKSTAAMIRLAQFYFDVDQVSKESGVPKDVSKGMDLARQAAELGNTDAQVFLAFAYAPGLFPESPVPKDRVTSLGWYTKAKARFADFNPVCNKPQMIETMRAQLPDFLSDRPLKSANVVTVRNDNELVCILWFGPSPASQGESFLDALRRQVAGTTVDRWCFTIVENEKTKDDAVFRETRGEALTGAMLRFAPAVNALAQLFDSPQKQ